MSQQSNESEQVVEQVVEPDIDLHHPAQRSETRSRQWDLLVATSAGGVIGALARHGLGLLIPHTAGTFPWSTVVINLIGSLLLGALMVLILELTSPHRLVRPFLGVGVLGGFTTFSAFAVDAQQLMLAHRPAVALIYVLVTVIGCGAAVWLSTALMQNIGRGTLIPHNHRRRHRSSS